MFHFLFNGCKYRKYDSKKLTLADSMSVIGY